MQNSSRLSLFLMLALLNLSCGDDTVMNTSGGEEGLRINEVLFSTSNDQIELKNFGPESVDVSTWWFCSLFAYAPISNLNIISGSLNIPPGGILAVSGFNLNNTAADLGLYETNNFTSSGAMHDFVQWGSAGNGRESVAVGKKAFGPPAISFQLLRKAIRLSLTAKAMLPAIGKVKPIRPSGLKTPRHQELDLGIKDRPPNGPSFNLWR